MTSKTLNFLRGVGSILSIQPPVVYPVIGQGLRGRTDADALRGDWERVGGYISTAMQKVAADVEVQKANSPTR